MPRFWLSALTLCLASTSAPAWGQAEQGPSQAAPQTVPMTAQMISGEGTVVFHPIGAQVNIHVVAKRLPPPATYSLWLVAPKSGGRVGREVAALRATSGNVDLRITIPAAELRNWRALALIHQPSGTLQNTVQAHPALRASIPPF